MALTQISTAGVKDDAVTAGKIPADAVGSSEIAANAVGSSELADNAVDTAAIADQAVALSKLPHGDSNNNGKFLRANNGADPSFETVSIPAGTTINNNGNKKVIIGTSTSNTLEADSGVFVGNTGKLSIGNTVASSQISNYSLDIKGDGTNAYVDLGDPFPTSSSGQFPTARLKTVDANKTLEIHSMWGGDNVLYKHIELAADKTKFFRGTSTNVEIAAFGTFGLTFNGDTAAANALDDYEEGTAFSSTGNATVYHATYVKVGNIVNIVFRLNVTSGGQTLSLPFAAASGDIHLGTSTNFYLNAGTISFQQGFHKGTGSYHTA